MYIQSTIAAIATPPGMGGVGIIRVSGDEAFSLGTRLFRPSSPKTFAPGRMYYGDFTNGAGEHVDSGLFVWFKGPRSFTGEDVVEFHCHGGTVILHILLKVLLGVGVRLAAPGEFSKRAFLNGKIDLAQAESISDMISASSERAAEIARSHFRGKLSEIVEGVRDEVASVLAWIEAEIDYPGEEFDDLDKELVRATLARQIQVVDDLQRSYNEGKIYREGIATVIIGSPNVGKSSLLNILTGEERAIVTDIPGTTRDVLEVPVTIRGIPLLLADTAGIRESVDLVERIGIERARTFAHRADLTLLIVDTSRPLSKQDISLINSVERDRTIILLNKTDLPAVFGKDKIEEMGLPHVLEISVLHGQGIETLKDRIESMFVSGKFSADTTMVSNQRHHQALAKASDLLAQVATNWGSLPLDLLALDLRQGWHILGEITGSAWTEELLDEIFQRFCLGK